MKTNITMKIDSCDHQGRGIGRIDGKVTFVYAVFPGEVIKITFMRTYKKYNLVEDYTVISENENRIEPLCPYFGSCGGCALQHMSQQIQLDIKSEALLEQLEHFGNTVPEKSLPFVNADPYHYRRKARLSVRYFAREDKVVIGFRHLHRSRSIVPIDKCMVMEKSCSDKLPEIIRVLQSVSIKDKIPQLEIMTYGSYSHLVIRHLKPLNNNDIKLFKSLGSDNWAIYLQSKGVDTTYCIYRPFKMDKDFSFYLHESFKYYVGVHDFVQVNKKINDKLLSVVLSSLNLKENDIVFDFFCGLGNFSLPLAKKVNKVFGYEFSKEMVDKASKNAKLNNIENAFFYESDLSNDFSFLKKLSECDGKVKILIDPPRSGALNLVKNLSVDKVSSIVYVSCNPASFARDAKILCDLGFNLKSTQIFDMFAQTLHSEVLGVFDLSQQRLI